MYEAPIVEIVELDPNDIVRTSDNRTPDDDL